LAAWLRRLEDRSPLRGGFGSDRDGRAEGHQLGTPVFGGLVDLIPLQRGEEVSLEVADLDQVLFEKPDGVVVREAEPPAAEISILDEGRFASGVGRAGVVGVLGDPAFDAVTNSRQTLKVRHGITAGIRKNGMAESSAVPDIGR
jgi:hypothetical protein